MNRPCSPCGDGDTAMKYHSHEHSNLHPFPARPSAKVGIAIDLDHLRARMKQFLIEMGTSGSDDDMVDWKFEAFLRWEANRQKENNQ